jgi:SAM-dependent methyltransferase
LRFAQLLKLCDFSANFALNDFGCGYGALVPYLAKCHPCTTVDYLGIDLASAMIKEADRLWKNSHNAKFAVGAVSARRADYSIASGIFNVKLYEPLERWEQFIAHTLANLCAASMRGFAVNFKIANDADGPPRWGLYATLPERWAQYCEQGLGCSPQILTDYGLDEFTLLARVKN